MIITIYCVHFFNIRTFNLKSFFSKTPDRSTYGYVGLNPIFDIVQHVKLVYQN